MSDTTPPPAGWYPDPKPADPDHIGERWWNGSEWTVSTRSDETTVFISGEPPAAPTRGPRRPLVVVGVAAALVGAGLGTLSTYLVMHHDNASTTASSSPFSQDGNGGQGGNGGSGGSGGLNPFGSGGGSTGGSGGSSGGGSTGGSGGSTGGSGGSGSNTAVDVVDGISFPVPSGWTGGTTQDGHASAYFGSYTCAGSSNSCSLAGVDSVTLSTPVSTGVQAAAETDISAAAKESYAAITGHQVLEQKAVTVAGRSGYLVRWQVDAKVGNNGTVETVVFPNTAGNKLVAVRMGFDIASKAPSVSEMDQIVSSITDFSAGALTGGGSAGSSGSSGSASDAPGSS
ncbi:DUF2510 domain-containing protein [Streptacidiphilus sp. MAP5-3]|uniref:DUF2510 domain-containing protein n=1 Tax=unclassified Streptacidiphilus TaxID=2643834 RepID=UPI003510DFE8